MGTNDLVNVDPRGKRRPSRHGLQDHVAATAARMRLDEHRAIGGHCVRCGTTWPCISASDAMHGNAAGFEDQPTEGP
ncbi:hypothetical protein ACFXDE_02230 [Kitasatospora sp. NPDC059408]|uniref:hypothetical protein n=1 Tax=Kitasatospora sp. NPDC059408 TaxID=3346823 RepID=UPI003685CB13